jgi:hypothetical protein
VLSILTLIHKDSVFVSLFLKKSSFTDEESSVDGVEDEGRGV